MTQADNGGMPLRDAVVYQIYPKTFHEHASHQPQTGHGTIRGAQEKLDYLQELGIDMIWLSPFFMSPMKDGGYDISDFMAVHPELGTKEDVAAFIAEAKARGIRVMIDLIPNHTSDEHEWFKESRSSRDNPKANWYTWHDPLGWDDNGQPIVPNNWASVFSMPQLEARRAGKMPWLGPNDVTPPLSAWQFDETRQQFYLHSFAPFQPDLNWQNPAVRSAIKDVMRFWLDLGVAAFRVDAIGYIGKNPKMPNEELNLKYKEGEHNPYDQWWRLHSCGYPPTFHPNLRELLSVTHEPAYADRNVRLMFEFYSQEVELIEVDALDPQKGSTFNFTLLDSPWEASLRKHRLDRYYDRIGDAIGNQVNGNHDKPRLATRFGESIARAAGLMNLLLPGDTYIYQGEELNLTDGEIAPDRVRDPNGVRDPARQPIPWDHTQPGAGFSSADESQFYLPLNPNDADKAVSLQVKDPASTYMMYKTAIHLRKTLEPLRAGRYLPLTTTDSSTVAFARQSSQGQEMVVVLVNFEDTSKTVAVPELEFADGNVIISSVEHDRSAMGEIIAADSIPLRPHETLAIIVAAQ